MMRAAAWYIDTINARSGYAFASYRVADLNEATALSDNCETVFIEAPYFVPERVGSRTLSLGAERAGFQAGLYLENGEEEVPFSTLEALTDFVRRAYGSGGASDGGGGVTPPVTPRSGDDGPHTDREWRDLPDDDAWRHEIPRGTTDDIDPVGALKIAHQEFASLIRRANVASPVPAGKAFDALLSFPSSRADGHIAAHRLARAALRLSIYVISFPEPARFSAEWKILDESGRHLSDCISRLDLWASIRLYLRSNPIARKQLFHVLAEFSHRGTPLNRHIFELERSFERADLLTRVLRGVLISGRRSLPFDHRVTDSSNRFADLGRIMIPDRLIPPEYRPRHASPSLRNLLAFSCNAFALIPRRNQDEVFETMLFGACYLNARAAKAVGGVPHPDYWDDFADAEPDASFDALQLVAATLPWIRANLPKYAFAQEVETSVAQTAAVGR